MKSAAYPHLGTEFAAEREEIRKADAGLGSEPWGVRHLLAEMDALIARSLQAKQEAFDREIKLTADNVRLRDAMVALLDAVEDYGLDAAFGDEKFKAVVAAREAVRRAT